MSSNKSDWQKFKEWDLQKEFPNYFNKTIFRIGFIFLAIYIVIMLIQTGGVFSYTVYECNSDICENPFYKCKNYNPQDFDVYNPTLESRCISRTDPKLCDMGFCEQEFLKYGEHIGTYPPHLAQKFYGFLFGLIVSMFIVNHLFYYWRRKT